MADQRRLEAALDVKVTSESHQSLGDFLKKVEAAEASARRMREYLNGGGGGAPNGGGGGSFGGGSAPAGPSVPWPGGATHSWTPSTGFTSPGGGYSGPHSIHQNINDYAQRMDRIEQQSRRIRENLNNAGTGAAGSAGSFHQPWLGERNIFGGRRPTQPGTPDDDERLRRLEAFKQRMGIGVVPDPHDALMRAFQDRQYAHERTFDFQNQTINKFPGTPERRQWGQTLMSGASAAIGMLGQPSSMLRAARVAGAPLAVAGLAESAGDAYHNIGMVETMGGTANEMARAGLKSNFFTRQGVQFADSLTGRSQSIAIQQYKNQFGMVDAGTQEQIRQFRNEIERDRIRLERDRDVRGRDTRFAALGQYNLRTVGGEIEQREAQRLIPVERERFERERVLQVERGVQEDLEKKLARLQREAIGNANEGGRMNIFNGDLRREGAAGLADISKWEQLSVKQRGLLAEIKQVAQAVEGQKGRVIEATANLNRVGVEELRARAGIVETRLMTAKGQAQRIGAMNPADLAQSAAAFRTIQQAGTLDGFPEELIQRAAQFDPATIQKMQENRGIQRIDAMGLVRDKVGAFRDQVPAMEDEYRRLTNAAEEAGVKIGQAAAKMAADMLKSPEFVKAITDAIKREGELEKNQLKAQQQQRNVVGN